MEKNYKGQVMIRSLDEISPEQRKKLHLASMGIGSLTLLIAVLIFLCFGKFPSNEGYLFFYCMDWIFLIVAPFAAFGFGACFGSDLMLSDLGFAFSYGYHGGSDSSSLNQAFSSHESSSFPHSSHYGSHASINPSSGRPMSGSSGMDTSGNPYGTRSW
jgi:hypothetical protein